MLLTLILVAGLIAETHWSALLACPGVSVPRTANGTGVIVGTKDGFAYVLTAAHIIGDHDAVEINTSSRERYPRPVWPSRSEVLARWPDPDVALLRFPLKDQTVSVLLLAPAWQRSREFPTAARSIGLGGPPATSLRGELILARDFIAREKKQPAFFWRTEVPPEPGRSGGPLLDDRGRVIGIAVASGGDRGYYTHHDEVLAALKRSGYGWLIPTK